MGLLMLSDSTDSSLSLQFSSSFSFFFFFFFFFFFSFFSLFFLAFFLAFFYSSRTQGRDQAATTGAQADEHQLQWPQGSKELLGCIHGIPDSLCPSLNALSSKPQMIRSWALPSTLFDSS